MSLFIAEFNESVIQMFMWKSSARSYARRARRRGFAATIGEKQSNWLMLGGRYGVTLEKQQGTPVAVAVEIPDFDANKFSPALSTRRSPRAVCIGWNEVDPRYYNGWRGTLADCEMDADNCTVRFRSLGIPTALLTTFDAPRDVCRAAMHKAMEGMQPKDLLIVSVSGHGGQQRDKDGDESDGMDEYLCAPDGPVLDDTIFEWLNDVPEGVRILWICDTCNSATMVRSAAGPVVFRDEAIPAGFKGELILLAGCADGKSSLSTGTGGQWTNSLMAMGPADKSPRRLFDDAAAYMQLTYGGQVPAFTTYKASEEFQNEILIT